MLSPHSHTPPSTTPSPSPPPMSVCPLGSSFHPIPDISLLFRLPIKRKASEEPDGSHDGVSSSSKDFDAGRVTCEACGDSVSYQDERTGAFTIKHWDAHKLGWFALFFLPLICPPSSPAHPSCLLSSPAASSASPAPEPSKPQARPAGASTELKAGSNSNSAPGPPSKRRRAKRSEEERIQYLRSDPYVAQFDAYRVLCASCDKWIRLRPNSTFCSIPWDAHRKSCLARKGCVVISPTLCLFHAY